MSARQNRIWVLDIARGVFMATMVISHSIFFFHANTSLVLQIVAGFGDIVSFTGLLVISGAASYTSYVHFTHPYSSIIVRLLKRLAMYILGYYLLAFLGSGISQVGKWDELLPLLTFQKLVPFTEFILPFILLGLLQIPLRPLFQALSKTLNGTIIVSTLVYFLSTYLAYQPGTFFGKEILVGEKGVFSFPLLGYLPLYLAGMYIGRKFLTHTSYNDIKKFLTASSVLLAAGIVLLVLSPLLFHLSPADIFNRFPPTPAFLLAGLAFSFFVMAAILELSELKNFPLSRTVVLLLGQNTFAILLNHTGLLYAYQLSGLPKVYSPILTGLLTLFSTLLSIYLSKILPLNYSFSLTFINWCECNWRKCKHAKEHSLVKMVKRWLIVILDIPQVFSVNWEGRTIQLIKKWNFVFAGSALLLAVTPLGIAENNAYIQSAIGTIAGSVNKTWVLTTEPRELTYTITIPQQITTGEPDIQVMYQLDNEPPQPMEKKDNAYTVSIPTKPLVPQTYSLIAHISLNYQTYNTQPTTFYITDPLFVTWTIDWEGYDALDEYLGQMEQIADGFGIPMTQLFNPRYFTSPDIPPERAEFLMQWVKRRSELHSDEIGLHLHMFPDFVKETGVTPITNEVWGGGWTPGYDVLTSAYSYDDMVKILMYAKEVFHEKGLPQPRSYRAGGWFADLDTLKALADSGFLVDSSGRTAYTFGTNYIPGFWDLTQTTPPFFPSTRNQNSANPPPRLSLLEVPNNGADDYAYSAEEMVNRFDANYAGGAINGIKQVTYLTHPNWFDPRRQEKMKNVFAHVNQFSNKDDNGPVVYTTLLGIYQAWTKNN